MKKQLTTALLVLALLLTMSGCSASGMSRRIDAAEDRMENRMDVLEDAVETAIRQEIAPTAPQETAPAVPESVPVPAQAQKSTITGEDAQQIALDYVGLKADQVQRLRTGFEVDDGIPQYDVEFLEGDWEYEFEIDANTGKILSFDKDHKYD